MTYVGPVDDEVPDDIPGKDSAVPVSLSGSCQDGWPGGGAVNPLHGVDGGRVGGALIGRTGVAGVVGFGGGALIDRS